jgi:diguanylate cyclase (GGDEF)-like protein
MLARWLSNRALRTKMLMAFGVLSATFVAGTVAALLAQEGSTRARALSAETWSLVAGLDRLSRAVSDQQLALRGYVITGKREFLDAHEAGREEFSHQLDVLQERLAGDALSITRLSQISTLMDQYWEAVADPMLDAMEHANSRAQAVASVTSGEDGRHLDEMRRQLSQMQLDAQALLAARENAVTDDALRSRWILLGVLTAGVVLGLLCVWVASAQVTRPLEEITGLMDRLAARDPVFDIPHLTRGDEIGALARALAVFKRMSQVSSAETWVKSGSASALARASRSRSLDEFASAALAELAPRLGAPLARFLRPGDAGEIARFGDGEWTAEQRYQKLSRPLVVGERTVGTLEFARRSPLEVKHERLLEEVLPVLALSFDSLGQGLRTLELLEETREKSDALLLQQRELRAAHDQLTHNAQQLELSERQLKAANEALREKSEIAHHQATHDPLTGLPNRLLFMDRLEQCIQRCRRSGAIFALAYVDIDGFKPVNDRHGHHAGDVLLGAIAGRLLESLRRSDTVARMGGDEFVLLMDEPDSEGVAFAAIERLGRRLAEPYLLNSPSLPETLVLEVGASIGVAFFPSDARSDDALLRAADAAMYTAKQAGKNRTVRAAELGVSAPGTFRPPERT